MLRLLVSGRACCMFGAGAVSRALATTAAQASGPGAAAAAAGTVKRVSVQELVAQAGKAKRSQETPATGSILDQVEAASKPRPSMRRDFAVASASNVKTARKKAEPVLELIRGLSVTDALRQLQFNPRAVARSLSLVVKAAMSNAENNFGMRRERLVITEAWAGRATPLKRLLYANKGRAGRKSRYRTHLYVKVAHVPFAEGEKRVGRVGKAHGEADRELHRVISAKLAAPATPPALAGSPMPSAGNSA